MVEKRFTFAKFRRFIVPEEQYEWMYQDPPAEDIKITKDTSKRIKEIWQYTISKIQ